MLSLHPRRPGCQARGSRTLEGPREAQQYAWGDHGQLLFVS